MKNKLRIAQIGSIWESTPPKLYGGTERVASLLTEGLVKNGHDVTLFATGDSKTKAKLISITPQALYRSGIPWSNMLYPLMHIYKAFSMKDDFDVMHIHLNMSSDFIALALAKLIKVPTVITIHFRLPGSNEKDTDRAIALNKFADLNYVSISNSQRKNMKLHYTDTVYNGIDFSVYRFDKKGGNKLGWIGRFTPDKGTYEAIQIAKTLKKDILLAGKIDVNDKNDQRYYKTLIEPELKSKKKYCHYIGEINDKQKSNFFGKLRCLVNPTNWDEPFGLVVVEANACGTPVVAFDKGAMSELIKDGVNGFVVKHGDMAAMKKRVSEIYSMSKDEYEKLREKTIEHAQSHFSDNIMVKNYEKVYYKILKI